jgi:hypothetical protein
MKAGTVDRTSETSADDMDFSIDGNDCHVIARGRQGRGLAPFPRSRIKDFVGCDHGPIQATSADNMNPAVDRSGADRSARRLHRRKHAPLVCCRIVLESTRAGAPVPDANEAAQRVDFAAGCNHPDMVASFRQWRAPAPGVVRRLVLVVIGTGSAVHGTADCMQLAVERGRRDFGAHTRQRRFHHPGARRGLTASHLSSRQGARDGRQQRDSDRYPAPFLAVSPLTDEATAISGYIRQRRPETERQEHHKRSPSNRKLRPVFRSAE